MTSPLHQLDEHLQASVDVSTETTRRARTRFLNVIDRKPARTIAQWSAAVSAIAIAALIIVTQASPSATPAPLSFLQSAQAAYADMRAKAVEMGDRLRHTVEVVEYQGVMNPGTERYERWRTSDGSRVLTKTESYLDAPPLILAVDNTQYVPQAFVHSNVVSLDDETTGVMAYDGDRTVSYLKDHHPVSFPTNLNSMEVFTSSDHLDVICYAFEWIPEEQARKEAFLKELLQATGAEGSVIGSAEQTIEVLLRGQKEGYVNDQGVQSNDGDMVQIFEVVVSIEASRTVPAETRTTQFRFDPSTHLLRSIRFQTENEQGLNYADERTILIDELVSLEEAPAAFMDPASAGLVEQPERHVEGVRQTIYRIDEAGCYRDTEDGVERLTPEEEAEVMATIYRPAQQ